MWPSEHEARAVQYQLAPGRITPDVVRIGDTVRRPASPQSRFVARLLTYLRARGFTACPRHLGWDALERHRLLDAVRRRQRLNVAFWTRRLHPHSTARAHARQVVAWTEREMAFTDAHGELFAEARA